MANYAERVWGFAYSLILARLILPEVFGIFAFGMSIAQVASILTRWEVGNLVRSDTYYQGEGFDILWSLSKLLMLVEFIVLCLVSGTLFFLGIQYEVCVTIMVCGLSNVFDKLPLLLKSDLEGQSKFKQNLKVKLLLPPAAALITIPMAMMGFGLWALLSSAWIGVGLNWWVFRRANRRKIVAKRPPVSVLKKVIRPSLWQWMNYLCYILFNRADKVALGAVEPKHTVGYYTRAFNYAPLSFIGLGAIAGVPAIVAFRDLTDYRAKWKVFIQRAGILVGAGLVNGVIWLLWAEELVVLLFGEEWANAAPYFKYFAFFGAVQGIYFLSGAIMQGCREYKAQALISLASIAGASFVFFFAPLNASFVILALQAAMILAAVGMICALLVKTRQN